VSTTNGASLPDPASATLTVTARRRRPRGGCINLSGRPPLLPGGWRKVIPTGRRF
jgi:hypothetical protein